MLKFFIRAGHLEKQLKGLRSLSERLTRDRDQPSLLTLGYGFLSGRSGLGLTAPPARGLGGAFLSAGSCGVRMFAHSAAPKTLLFRQGVHGLLGSSGEGAVGEPVRARVQQQLRWGSFFAGFPAAAGVSLGSDCLWRSFRAKGRGGRKKFAEMVSGEEGVKQKAPKTKRRGVEGNGAHLPSDEMPGTKDAGMGPSSDNCGGIHVIVGPMFAGKSTALLRRVQDEASVGRKVVLVKSDKDTRYGLSCIVTHDGLQMPCYAVPDLATFKTKVGGKFYKELDVIGIDEAQFFTDLYEFCQHAADFEGKTIIVAGLDGDFLRRKFGSTLDLIPVADSVVKLSSRCEICGRPAIFSFRKTLDRHTELVGGADVYMPVCRQHFVNGQIAVETASTVIGAHQVAQMNNE